MSTGSAAKQTRLPFSKDDWNAFGLLLTPSWISGLTAVFAGLSLVGVMTAMLRFKGSNWQLVLAEHHTTIGSNLTTLESRADTNTFFSDLPLFVFWAGIGLIVYFLITSIFGAFQAVIELEEESHYVHAQRGRMIGRAVFHLLLRLIFLVLWIFYIRFTIHWLLPYIVALTYAGNGQLGWFYDGTYLVGAAALAIIGLHLHVVVLRLLLLKPRIFG